MLTVKFVASALSIALLFKVLTHTSIVSYLKSIKNLSIRESLSTTLNPTNYIL